jgi:hypothetical protein
VPISRGQLEAYLVSILRGFVLDQNKIVVTSEEFPNTILYHISLAKKDIDNSTITDFTQRALTHLMRKATQLNVGKDGGVDPVIGQTT